MALGPEKLPELEKTDLGHFDAGVGFDAPQQVGTAPRRDPVTTRAIPEKAQHLVHHDQYSCTGKT